MDDENMLRLEVAVSCRIAEYLGLFDFSGHASARIPTEEAMFINSRDSVRSDIKPQDIIKVNLNAGISEEQGMAPSEVFIHTAIYQNRSDVNAVAHLHSPAIIALSVAKKKFIPVIPRGSVFAAGVPLYDDSRTINSMDSGQVLAGILGQRRAVILRAHGSVVVANNLKELLFYALSLELNARDQLAAYQAGEQPCILREEEIKEGNRLYGQRLFEKAWDYYLKKAAINFK